MRNAPRTQLMYGYDDDRAPRTYHQQRRDRIIDAYYYYKYNVGGKLLITVLPSSDRLRKFQQQCTSRTTTPQDRDDDDDNYQGGAVVFTTGLSHCNGKHRRLSQMVFLFFFSFLRSYTFVFLFFIAVPKCIYLFGLVEFHTRLSIVGRVLTCRTQCLTAANRVCNTCRNKPIKNNVYYCLQYRKKPCDIRLILITVLTTAFFFFIIIIFTGFLVTRLQDWYMDILQ